MTPESSEPLVIHLAAVAFTAEKLLLPQLHFLAESGYNVRVACAPDDDGYPSSLEPFKPLDIRFPRSLRPLKILRATGNLVIQLRATRPDILHLHTPAAAIPVRLLPRFVFPSGMKIVYTVHGYAHTWSGSRRDVALQLLERLLTPRADVVLFQSKEDLSKAQAHGFRGNLVYLGNGVEDQWFEISPPVRSGPLKLLYAGRLVAEKGIPELLEAVEGCEGVELAIAGAALDSDRDGVQELVEAFAGSHAGSVRYDGMLTRDELMSQMEAADAVVLPSHREGVPRFLIEGLAAARPGIATQIRGCRELIEVGINGFLVEVGSSSEIRGAIERLRDLPTEVFKELAASARRSTQSRNRETAVFERLNLAYRKVLGDR